MGTIFNDLRYAFRSLRRTPGFTTAAVLTLAIGIGANTAIFSLAQALILRPIAIPEPDRVVQLGVQIFSYQIFRNAPQRTSAYAGVAILHPNRLGVARENGAAVNAQGLFVSTEYFSVLHVPAIAGRVLQAHDARDPGTSPVVVLAHAAAVRHFGSAETAIGKTLVAGGRPVEVIGVTPREFRGTKVAMTPDLFVPRFDVIARLQPGVSLEQAAARLEEIMGPAWGAAQPPAYILNYVSPDYFETVGITLRRGRVFTTASSPEDVVVSESLARLVAGDDDPLGRRFMTNQGAQHIIGVVRDIKARDLHTNEVLFLYRRYGIRGGPYRGDLARLPAGGTIHIRARRDPSALIPTVSALLRGIDATVPLGEARLFRDHVDRWMAQSRSLVAVVGLFGILAFVLSAVGLYGLISQSVAAQMKEIGIRMALGAQPTALQQSVLVRCARLAGIGIAIGLLIVVSGGEKLIGSVLFDVSPTDAITIAGAAAILLGTSLLASYVPARRAAHVDPSTVLRTE